LPGATADERADGRAGCDECNADAAAQRYSHRQRDQADGITENQCNANAGADCNGECYLMAECHAERNIYLDAE
jgi:hypothetical protein